MDLERLQSELDMTGRVSAWATRQLITEVKRLKAENEKLKANQELWGSIELITAQRKENEQLREALEGVSGNLVPGHGLCWCFADRLDTPATVHDSICRAAREALKDKPK